MLRLWHHVGEEPARALLFEDFVIGGRALGLLDAIVCTAHEGRWRGRLPRGLDGLATDPCDEVDRLCRAFAAALADALGPLASPMVQRAWREALAVLLGCPTA